MQINHLVYDLDIDIILVNYDQIIQECEKYLNIRRETVIKQYFNDNYYFFLLGKYDFRTFIRSSFADFSLTNKLIDILLESYKNAINVNYSKLAFITNEFSKSNIISFFMGSYDKETAEIIRSNTLISNETFIFSSDTNVNVVKPDFKFFIDIKKQFKCNPVTTLLVDDNIDSLINAKQLGYITYFYDGKVNLYNEIQLKIIN